MHSCIYRGVVRHERYSPSHRFQYSTSWFYLDLDEVDEVLHSSWLLGSARFAVAAYRRNDHFGDRTLTMSDCVRRYVREKAQVEFSGPVRLLTQLRHFGFYFSPLNVFYCFDDDEQLSAIVAEVSNTPWNQRHCYVLWDGNRIDGSRDRYSHSKDFHVSPFMDMQSFYDWRVTCPTGRLHLSIGSRKQDQRIFLADLNLHRYPLSDFQVFKTMLRRPVAAAQISGAIYYQAFRLWMKKCQYYPHPSQVNDPRPVKIQSERAAAPPEPLEQS